MAWTLNAFWTAAWTDRNRCADPGDLNRCIFRSRRRTGRCEFSARLFLRKPCSCRAVNLSSDFAAAYERSLSVTSTSGAKPCFLSSLRISFTAAVLSRRRCTSRSRTSPSSSTACQSQKRLPAIRTAIWSRCHVWVPPFAQDGFESFGRVIGCYHVSGLQVRPVTTAGRYADARTRRKSVRRAFELDGIYCISRSDRSFALTVLDLLTRPTFPWPLSLIVDQRVAA